MHPNPAFRETDETGLVARAVAIGFAHIVANTSDGLMVVHAPVTAHGHGLAFHVARANRIAGHLDGATVLLSIVGEHGYISPNWYAEPGDQVPTWNYRAIEIDGVAHALDEAALIAQLDALAAAHEPRVNPAAPWTRDKTDPAVFARMLGAIRGFSVEITAMRGTTKLSQNKQPEDRAGVVAGLRASGNDELAGAMASLSPRHPRESGSPAFYQRGEEEAGFPPSRE